MSTLDSIPISVLDVAPVGEGMSTTEALQSSIALARRAEELGYNRFWVAEHHSMPGIASSAPAVLIAAIAAATREIRVGSGGVMLPNHAPLVIAEQFGTLAALYPNRIDLGLGRAPGSDQLAAYALRRQSTAHDDFPEQLGELACFLSGEFPAEHPFARVLAVPRPAVAPPLWLLGSSDYSAHLAGLLGLPFAFAHHFSGANTLPALARYRASFRPSATLEQPHAMVTVQTVVGLDDDDATRLALPSALSFLRLRQGRPGPLPTPESAAAHPWTSAELQFAQDRAAGQAIGGPDTVRQALIDLVEATQADELMITTFAHGAADRLHALEVVRHFAPIAVPVGR